MSWTIRLLMSAMCAMLLMPGNAQASREAPKCECESAVWHTVDQIWASESVEEVAFEAAYCPELRVYRNTVYARHGFNFTNDWVKGWFTEHEPRWTPIESVTSETVGDQLSDVDRATVQAALKWEDHYECSDYWEQRSKEEEVEDDSGEADADAEPEEPAESAAPEYVVITIASGSYEVDEVTFLEYFAVTVDPNFVIGEVFSHRAVESEWLVPFTCRDLQIVNEAVNNRSSQPSNQDQLTLLRVKRERRNKRCDQPVTD